MKIRAATIRNIKEVKKTKADAICVYCAGCLATYATAKKLYFGRIKVYHIIELLQLALGEKPMSRKEKKKRAKHFFWGIMKKQFPKLYSKKTFKIEDLPEDPPPYSEAY